MNAVYTSIGEYLAENEYLTYHFSGVSMRPMLRQEKDLVTIRRYDGRGLRKYDVAMYERIGSKQYVLHRVVEVRPGSYTFLGDNCLNKEKNISESMIVAVLDSFIRDGKQISVNSLLYKAYARVHCALFPVRRYTYMARNRLAKVPLLKKLYHMLPGKH